MKILTLNLRHDADRWPQRRALIVAGLAAERAEVVCLQEVALPIRQAHLLADDVNHRLGVPLYRVFEKSKWGSSDPSEGIAILTRLPVREIDAIDLPKVERVAQHIQVEHGGLLVDVINTHLHHLPHGDEDIRLPQAQAIREWMARLEDRGAARRWLVCGDFNAQPASPTIQAMTRGLHSAYAAAHGAEPARTFPTPLVSVPDGWSAVIDYIFFDPQRFRVAGARLAFDQPAPDDATLYVSDHYGLCAEVEALETPV